MSNVNDLSYDPIQPPVGNEQSVDDRPTALGVHDRRVNPIVRTFFGLLFFRIPLHINMSIPTAGVNSIRPICKQRNTYNTVRLFIIDMSRFGFISPAAFE